MTKRTAWFMLGAGLVVLAFSLSWGGWSSPHSDHSGAAVLGAVLVAVGVQTLRAGRGPRSTPPQAKVDIKVTIDKGKGKP